MEAGLANLRTMIEEMMKRQSVVEQPAVQSRQEEQTPNQVQVNLREQFPITPSEAHGFH